MADDALMHMRGGEMEDGADRRRRSPKTAIDQLRDLVQTLGALAGAAVAIGAALGIMLDKIPFAKTEDLKTYQEKTNQEFTGIKQSIGGIQLTQMQSLEITLTDRVQRLGDQITRTPANSPGIQELRHDQNEAAQYLENIKSNIRNLQRNTGGP